MQAGRPWDGAPSGGGCPSRGMLRPPGHGPQGPAVAASSLSLAVSPTHWHLGAAAIAVLPLCFHPAGSLPALVYPRTGQD